MVMGALEIDTLRQMYCTRIAVGGQQLQHTFYCCYIVEAVQHIQTYLSLTWGVVVFLGSI